MTDETRAELRRGIEAVIRAIGLKDSVVCCTANRPAGPNRAAEVAVYFPGDWSIEELAELTAAQHLALSVLLGDPAVSVDVLIDCLVDTGAWSSGALEEVRAAAYREGYEKGRDDGDIGKQMAKAMAPVIDAYTEFGQAVYRLHRTAPPT